MESAQSLCRRRIEAVARLFTLSVALAILPGRAQDLASLDWTPLDAAVRAQIAAGRVPGAVAVFGDADHVWLRRAWGLRAREPQAEPMAVETVFDLASLTKVVATTTAVMQLSERGMLQLDAPAARYWPAFGANGKRDITVRQLLSHTSGLQADLDLREDWSGRGEALKRVIATKPIDRAGHQIVYSDINFIVLGELVHRVSGQALERYVQRRVLGPLGMRDSGYLPRATLRARIAPTEAVRGQWLRGIVHDPTARRMGGVAGHAGLFGTADDLARFAQALLRGSGILRPESVAEMISQQAIAASERRGLGWQLQAPMVANRDELASVGAAAHTGYTGTALWIDFAQGRFLVLLTNRVHPDGRGDARPLRRQVLALLSSLAPPHSGEPAPAASPATVATGIDVLRTQGYALLAGRRVGLITHLAAIDALGWRTLDRLRWAPGVTLVKVFSPEHGLYGDADGPVPSGREPFSGVPLVSLYGALRKPGAEVLQDIDTLVFDAQDVGTRFFTYASTMGLAMEAAAEHGLRFVVLDRPNPLRADRPSGPMLDDERRSFTGYASLPMLHGMTLGELARMFADEIAQRRGLHVDLQVVAMQGYRREQWFDRTGLDWVPPSPNLRTLNQVLLYPGVAWVEGANLSVGRGTGHPFEWVGAPWVDATRWAEALNAAALPGLRFAAIEFTPETGRYRGVPCHGVRIEVTDRDQVDAPLLGAHLVASLLRLSPGEFEMDRTMGIIGSADTFEALQAGIDPGTVAGRWEDALARFRERRQRYLIY